MEEIFFVAYTRRPQMKIPYKCAANCADIEIDANLHHYQSETDCICISLLFVRLLSFLAYDTLAHV